MIDYGEALRLVLEHTRVLEVEERPLPECAGRVSADDIYAGFDLPLSDRSAPDGYAVRSVDIAGASKDTPVTLRIAQTVRAGRAPRGIVKPGTAFRIMTGSVLPEGADCVVRFEDTDEPVDKNGPNKANPAKVAVYLAASPGANVIRAGNSIRKGGLLLPGGTVIGPAQISALISSGRAAVRVVRPPVIAIAATGDELVSPGKPLHPARSYNSNTAAVAALVSHYGAIPKALGIARDKEASIRDKILRGMAADAIITSGGVSKGDYDLVRLVLGKSGEVVFARIKMGPGASVAFGLAERPAEGGEKAAAIPVFALAGPPSGCMINFETLVRPALLKMQGYSDVAHPSVVATATDSMPRKMPMAFVRWTLLEQSDGEYRVTLDLAGKKGPLAAMASANSLTIVPEGTIVKAGDRIGVLPLDWRR